MKGIADNGKRGVSVITDDSAEFYRFICAPQHAEFASPVEDRIVVATKIAVAFKNSAGKSPCPIW